MGYTTEFNGSFDLKFNDESKREEVIKLVNGLATTRRMKRDLSKLGIDLDKPIEDYGIDGEFYLVFDGDFGQSKDSSIINSNSPPSTQPGLWLQWEIDEENDTLQWDNNEKFYNYIEWLEYLIAKIFIPNEVVVSGSVDYRGEEWDDNGTITIVDNKLIGEYY